MRADEHGGETARLLSPDAGEPLLAPEIATGILAHPSFQDGHPSQTAKLPVCADPRFRDRCPHPRSAKAPRPRVSPEALGASKPRVPEARTRDSGAYPRLRDRAYPRLRYRGVHLRSLPAFQPAHPFRGPPFQRPTRRREPQRWAAEPPEVRAEYEAAAARLQVRTRARAQTST